LIAVNALTLQFCVKLLFFLGCRGPFELSLLILDRIAFCMMLSIQRTKQGTHVPRAFATQALPHPLPRRRRPASTRLSSGTVSSHPNKKVCCVLSASRSIKALCVSASFRLTTSKAARNPSARRRQAFELSLFTSDLLIRRLQAAASSARQARSKVSHHGSS